MKAKIIGISQYEKNNIVSYTLHFLQEFSEYEKANGAKGVKIGSEWTRLPVCETLRVNDLVELRYEPGFQGKATLSDVVRYSSSEKHYLNNFVVPSFAVAVPGKPDDEKPETETATTAKNSK